MKIYSAVTHLSSDDLPAGLDPHRHRIICEHYFGLDPATVAAKRVATPAFQHRVRKVARLGERVICELLAEIASRHDIADDLDATLLRFDRPERHLVSAGRDRLHPAQRVA